MRLCELLAYFFLLLHADQAKADNKKPAAITAKAAPVTSPIRDITNGMAKTSLATPPASLSKRFDSSSATNSPAPSPTSASPAPVEVPVVSSAAPLAAAAPSTAAPVADSAEEGEMTYEEAVKRREERELEQAKLMCSLENKEACVMCSG